MSGSKQNIPEILSEVLGSDNKTNGIPLTSNNSQYALILSNTEARLRHLLGFLDAVIALGPETINIFCRDNAGASQAYVNLQTGLVDIFGSDGANFGSTGFTTIGAGVLDIQSDNNISIIANGTDIIIQSILDQIQIDGALGITFLNGGGTSPVRSEPQFIIGLTPTAFNAWLSLRNGSVSRAALALEAQANYTGANQPGLVWNSSVNKSLIEQQTIGNKSLVGFISGATGDSNTVANTIVATLITTNGYTFVIPLNSLSIGKRIRVNYRGRYSTNVVAPSLTFNVQLGATIIRTTGARVMENSLTNRGFRGTVNLRIVSIGAAGTVNVSIESLIADTAQFIDGSSIPNVTNVAINTTIANTLQMSVQWSLANAANSITFEDITYEILN